MGIISLRVNEVIVDSIIKIVSEIMEVRINLAWR